MKKKTKQDLVHELVEATRASQVATDKMDDAGSRALGVNRTDGRCLDVIQQAGRISAGDLAERAGLTSGSITGTTTTLTKSGSSTLSLLTNNTYGGGTTINGGTIQINSAASLGAMPEFSQSAPSSAIRTSYLNLTQRRHEAFLI